MVETKAHMSLIPTDILSMVSCCPRGKGNLLMAALCAWIKISCSRLAFIERLCTDGSGCVPWNGSSSIAAEQLQSALEHVLRDEQERSESELLSQRQLSRDGTARHLGMAAVGRALGVATP